MMIKSNFLFFIWIFAYMFFIVNPLYKHIGVIAYSVIEYPPCLAVAALVIIIPLGFLSLADLVNKAVRKIMTRMSKEK
jgi:hypothetical protein